MSATELPRLWRALKAALAAIDPRIPENLYPGADDGAIERLRAGLTVDLPPELEALYRENNGEGRLGLDYEAPVAFFWVGNPARATGRNDYYFMEIDGLDGVVTEFAAFTETADRRADLACMERRGPVRNSSTAWIPFAKDFGGNYLCVDLDPDIGGTPGQIIEAAFDDGRLGVVSTGLATYLTELHRALTRG